MNEEVKDEETKAEAEETKAEPTEAQAEQKAGEEIDENKKKEEKKKKRKTVKPTLSPKELKLKMAQIRDERDQAREAKDKNKVDILRRRLNRIKKQTRKAAQA